MHPAKPLQYLRSRSSFKVKVARLVIPVEKLKTPDTVGDQRWFYQQRAPTVSGVFIFPWWRNPTLKDQSLSNTSSIFLYSSPSSYLKTPL